MSRAQRAAAALNDLKGLFGEEDSSALEEVALDYFTGYAGQTADSEDMEEFSEDESLSSSTGRYH